MTIPSNCSGRWWTPRFARRGAHIVACWPAGVHQRLVEVGLLRSAANLHESRPLSRMRRHIEEVLGSTDPAGVPALRFHVRPLCGPTSAVCDQTVDGRSRTFPGESGCQDPRYDREMHRLVPGRLWRLGHAMERRIS